ncbi:TIGR01244 family sulfur transferase [Paraburkholderia tropica]|uniref:TIGR01244 family sulfur transferase n=1 Tax=Paraburkholderia tropica TaxID=92647 RepID=UPI002AB6B321|nr:TIGR01244 family sulfur transferase [Paraburkholderia tropica]
MDIHELALGVAVCAQITPEDVVTLARDGYRAIVCARPDGEAADQPEAARMEAAAHAAGLRFAYLPVTAEAIQDEDVARFRQLMHDLPGPVLGYCRSGKRAAALWALAQAGKQPSQTLIDTARAAGYDLSSFEARLAVAPPPASSPPRCEVLIVGGGAAGLATAASLLKRRPHTSVTVLEPSERHYYQPGWTMVGGGIFEPEQTFRPMQDVMPRSVTWIRVAAAGFDPDHQRVSLADGRMLAYDVLIVAAGLTLDWDAIPGLRESLGHHGVTSNYAIETAAYTWQLVHEMKKGVALFTQPPMPVKCPGAPQKALYLSASHWRSQGCLDAIDIGFHNAGAALFGVKEYVPALMEYIKRYRADLRLNSRLTAVDGPARKATFVTTAPDGLSVTGTRSFDMLHVCPPQRPPESVRTSALADAAGWVDVDVGTLQHKRYANVFALGDAGNSPNSKTAAAARKQAPVVAVNVVALLDGQPLPARYDGYGSCPLTVERGKIVLAEFGYGGKLMPTFPSWLIDGTRPSRLAWHLKEEVLPELYWKCMLRGREWLCEPALVDQKIAAMTGQERP